MNFTKEEREEMAEKSEDVLLLFVPANPAFLPIVSDFVARATAMGLHVRTTDEPGDYIKATAY